MKKFIIAVIILGVLFTAGAAYADVEPFASAADSLGTVATGIIEGENPNNMPFYPVPGKTYSVKETTAGGLTITSRTPLPPPITEWNFKVTTSSRVYYARNVESYDGGVKIYNFYLLENDYWQYYKGVLELPEKIYGQARISNAPEYDIRVN